MVSSSVAVVHCVVTHLVGHGRRRATTPRVADGVASLDEVDEVENSVNRSLTARMDSLSLSTSAKSRPTDPAFRAGAGRAVPV